MSEKYSVHYSAQARDDLRNIYTYIAYVLKEKRTAKNLIDRIRKEVRSLEMFPERFHKVEWEPWVSQEMRQASVGNYIVYYQADTQQKTVTIYRIAYGGRDIENILSGE